MKKKQIFITLTSLVLTACNLDYYPTTAVSDSSLTESDYANLLTGVYDGAQSIKINIDDIAADNLTSPGWWPDIDNNGQTASTSSDINSLWNSHYKYVQLANNLINLIADPEYRIKAGHRLLEDHTLSDSNRSPGSCYPRMALCPYSPTLGGCTAVVGSHRRASRT